MLGGRSLPPQAWTRQPTRETTTVRQSGVTQHCSPRSSGGSRVPHTQNGKNSGGLAQEDLVCDAAWPSWVPETSVTWFLHKNTL